MEIKWAEKYILTIFTSKMYFRNYSDEDIEHFASVM